MKDVACRLKGGTIVRHSRRSLLIMNSMINDDLAIPLGPNPTFS